MHVKWGEEGGPYVGRDLIRLWPPRLDLAAFPLARRRRDVARDQDSSGDAGSGGSNGPIELVDPKPSGRVEGAAMSGCAVGLRQADGTVLADTENCGEAARRQHEP
jgi:hypothetical protein